MKIGSNNPELLVQLLNAAWFHFGDSALDSGGLERNEVLFIDGVEWFRNAGTAHGRCSLKVVIIYKRKKGQHSHPNVSRRLHSVLSQSDAQLSPGSHPDGTHVLSNPR